jgi:hypothetical protein
MNEEDIRNDAGETLREIAYLRDSPCLNEMLPLDNPGEERLTAMDPNSSRVAAQKRLPRATAHLLPLSRR